MVTHNSEKHEIELTNLFEEYIGRLKIQIPLSNRIRDRYLEKVYDEMIVKEILPASYTGEEFLGYENINLSFKMLKNIINSDEKSWRKALENILGIYLITDSLNGKLYVGSAYGENGLWSRWKEYTATGHGGNKKLQKVSKNMGIDYLFENFSMSLLEVIPPNKTIDYVLKREKHWKKCLSSQNHGYNEN